MKNIVIISYYELKDYFLYVEKIFEQHKFTVINYSLFKYAYDKYDKIEHYEKHMNEFIQSNNIDIILWWFIDVPLSVFNYIKQNNMDKLFIIYNSNDPINVNSELLDKIKLFDILVTSSNHNINLYKSYPNFKSVIFGPMGYDPILFHPISQNDFINEYEEFNCDISMVLNNFFSNEQFPDQVVSNKDLIDNIINLCETNKYRLKLYGISLLKDLYPKYYCGIISYNNLNFLFNFSKINIINSPSKDIDTYINENVMQILGSGGLLLHDKTNNIDKILLDGTNCILYNDNNYCNLINDILSNYEKYVNIRKNTISLEYSWDKWVENIMREIGINLFDGKLYSQLYNLKLTDDDLLKYWKEIGCKSKQICFDFNVPDNFNTEEYIKKTNIKNNKKYAYLHWFVNGKSNVYIKNKIKVKSSSIPLITAKSDIIMEDYYDVCTILNKVIKCDTVDEGLIKLNTYCSDVPHIKINDILNKYIENIF